MNQTPRAKGELGLLLHLCSWAADTFSFLHMRVTLQLIMH